MMAASRPAQVRGLRAGPLSGASMAGTTAALRKSCECVSLV
ncbi:protein of unassigned function [Methylobacterium oryzae CBMB20]|uniref:Protein of unassigned function n=1 Tax=Methylobacterium oryzae CBMB20 TaxID=693986 RepID=A0A089P1H2_9HYPH|nr:protein of unassigned function [Methylobacterium oryzae CBMB20]